jgi:L-ascorbate metabolism protein UlaG (beta-lactamase superfamily)
MKIMTRTAIFVLVLALSIGAEQPQRPPLTVTYVGNEGFLIESGGKKILIDALFGGFDADWCQVPSDSFVELMSAAQPPFDKIDIIALTHAHVDHFSPEIAVAHLRHNRNGVMICTPQAAAQMDTFEGYSEIKARLRIVPAPGDTAVNLDISGIDIIVLPTHHNVSMRTDTLTDQTYDRFADVQHLEYLINIGGWNLYHSGDSPQYDTAAAHRFGLDRQAIDIAFLQWWGKWNELSRRQKMARETLKPEWIIFMHLRPGRIIPDQPPEQIPLAREIIVPVQQLDRWVFE